MPLKMYAEVLQDGEWKKVGKRFKSTYPQMENILTDRPCDEYNLVLYEILTGEHFEQNDKYTKINPIDAQKNDNGSWIIGLSDILSYNWDATISNIGIISEWQYKRFKGSTNWPVNIRRDVLYKDYNVISAFEMDMILKDESLRNDKKYYVRFEYDARPIRNECKFFCEETIPALIKLRKEYKDVRIVCFNNT